jgi:hypothetical protein
MIPMNALVGFSDRVLATEQNPSGSQAAASPFSAPSADAANHLEREGLAERVKPVTASPASKT